MADPADVNNVVLLANFVGTDNATSYTADIDTGANALTLNNGAKLENNIPLFGNTVLYLDGSDDHATWGDQADLQFLHDQTESFTVEWWQRPWSNPSDTYTLSTGSFSGAPTQTGCKFNVEVDNAGAVKVYISNDAGSNVAYIYGGTILQSTTTWKYLKITFDHTTRLLSLYSGSLGAANTTLAGSTTASVISGTLDTNLPLYIGRRAAAAWQHSSSRIGPLRITKGEALADTDIPDDIFEAVPVLEAWGVFDSPVTSTTTKAYGFQDVSALLGDTTINFVMDFSSNPGVYIPITSWQATKQLERAGYGQCVVKEVETYVDAVQAAYTAGANFTVYQTLDVGGVQLRYSVASFPMGNVTVYDGSFSSSIVITGNSDPATAPDVPATRLMPEIRTQQVTYDGARRLRCSFDIFLRPGDTVDTGTETFTADYINYYAAGTGGVYMDVGTR